MYIKKNENAKFQKEIEPFWIEKKVILIRIILNEILQKILKIQRKI